MEPITKDFFISTLTSTLAASLGAFRVEMKDEFDKTRREFDGKLGDMARSLRKEMRDLNEELKTELKTELKNEISGVKTSIEALRHDMNRGFEDVSEMITYVGEKVYGDHEERITILEQ